MSDLFLIPSGVKDFVINKTYSNSALLIEIIPPNFRTNWYKAGYLKILLPVGNRWVPISNKPIIPELFKQSARLVLLVLYYLRLLAISSLFIFGFTYLT